MDEILSNLNKYLELNSSENIVKLLKSSDITGIQLLESKPICQLLKNENIQVLELTVQNIAEWAKTQRNRKILSEKEVIDLLLGLLNSKTTLTINIVRALGNIFYDNELTTNIISREGIDKILKFFYELKLEEDYELILKITGLLLNITTCEVDLQFIDKKEIIEHLASILAKRSQLPQDSVHLLSYVLQIIYTLMVEYGTQINHSPKLYREMIDIFKFSNFPELEVIGLQIFYSTAETDEVRKILAETNVCEKVIELIEKYKGLIDDEESRSILKMACDLINNILIEDDSMKLLYDQGTGEVYKSCLNWLDSNDEDLLSTAVIAVGNFARNDENCIAIVGEGVSKRLIDLLNKYNKSTNVRILHGLLSTLKNMVVPKINKKVIIEQGILSAVLPILELNQDIVVFKLLGTLRLLINGQEEAAKRLIAQDLFLVTLIKWFNRTNHLGVKRESARLLAWLIKYCHSYESMRMIIRTEGAIECLSSMLSSEDLVIENEAFVSFRELAECSYVSEDSSEDNIRVQYENQILQVQFAKIFPYSRLSNHDEQSQSNAIILLEKLFRSNRILSHFREEGISNYLKELTLKSKSQMCIEKTEEIISTLSV